MDIRKAADLAIVFRELSIFMKKNEVVFLSEYGDTENSLKVLAQMDDLYKEIDSIKRFKKMMR